MWVENSPRGAYNAKRSRDSFLVEQATTGTEQASFDQQSSSRDRGREGPDDEPENILTIKTTEEKIREAERIIASEIVYFTEIPETLAGWICAAAGFMLCQSLILFFIASRGESVDYHLFTSYPDETEDDVIFPDLKEIRSFSVAWLIPLMTLLSGVEHACALVFRGTYEWYVARHQNPFRWAEYSFSAPLVKVIIAAQVGVTDIHLLTAIFMLTNVCILCGASHESNNAKARSEKRPLNWTPFITGAIAQTTAWSFILSYFTAFNNRVENNGSHIWLIIVVFFVLDNSFALLFFLQWKRIGPFEDYLDGEKAFLILSATSKSLLAWISVANSRS